MAIPTDTPWAMLRSELASYISNQAANADFSGLQLVTTPLDATWDDKTDGTWEIWEQFANLIPKWGPVYEPQAGTRVDSAFFTFLTNIAAPAPDKAKADAAAAAATIAANSMSAYQAQASKQGEDWVTFQKGQASLPPNRQMSFDAWLAQYGQALSIAYQQYLTDLTAYEAAANAAGGGWQSLAIALNAYQNTAFQLQLQDVNGSKFAYRTWSVTPDLAKWLKEAKKGAGTALDLDIATSSSTTNMTSWGVSATVGFTDGFIGVDAEGGYNRSTVDTTSSSFAMHFHAAAFGTVLIQPGQWYDGSVVKEFGNGPFIAGGPYDPAGPTKATFFGQAGTFNLIPVEIYIAYQPAVTASLDQSSYSDVKQGWSAGLGISIGPFRFGGKTTGSTDTATFDDATRKVGVVSKSPHPQVIAVNCQLLGPQT